MLFGFVCLCCVMGDLVDDLRWAIGERCQVGNLVSCLVDMW